jgi:hypothetical protein
VTLALADELFLITHDLQSGKAKVTDPALGVGLSAALLTELVFSGSLVVANNRIELGEYPPPAELLAETLLEQARNQLCQQEMTIPDWLTSHCKLALDLVAERMVRAGELRRAEHKRLGRTIVRFHPVKPAEAFIRAQRLSAYLRTRSEISAGDATLAGLVSVMASGSTLLDIDDSDQTYLKKLVPLLPLPLQEIITATESFILAALRRPQRAP